MVQKIQRKIAAMLYCTKLSKILNRIICSTIEVEKILDIR